jgi:hypothetical protein
MTELEPSSFRIGGDYRRHLAFRVPAFILESERFAGTSLTMPKGPIDPEGKDGKRKPN